MKPKTTKNHWDVRYAAKDFHYGKEPNNFFKQEIEKLSPGRILLPAEGEGRNAIYAAKLGWKVVAFDSSVEGMKKALRFAKEEGVEIEYQLKSYDEFWAEEASFDAMALIYAHDINRQKNHRKLVTFLKPNGKILLEGFSKEQLAYGTGGPPILELLFSEPELKEDFKVLGNLTIKKIIKPLTEGENHKGKASIIRLWGIK